VPADWHEVEPYGQAFAVLVSPHCADSCPEALFAALVDCKDCVCRLPVGHFLIFRCEANRCSLKVRVGTG
jgi:hypothetical protein